MLHHLTRWLQKPSANERALQALYDHYDERCMEWVNGDPKTREGYGEPVSDEDYERFRNQWIGDTAHIQLGIRRAAETLGYELKRSEKP